MLCWAKGASRSSEIYSPKRVFEDYFGTLYGSPPRRGNLALNEGGSRPSEKELT